MIAIFGVAYHYYSPSLLQQIKRSNELIVITRNSPSTYYIGNDGPAGFEYELAEMFADYLDVKLSIIMCRMNFTKFFQVL